MQSDDLETSAPAPSLVHRLVAVARRRRAGAAGTPATTAWPQGRIAALVGVLIAAGPLTTIAGAKLLAGQQRAAAARIEGDASPRIAAAKAATEARAQIDAVLRRGTLGATIEALARALPADATLVRAGRTAQGVLEIEVAAADPDRLRAALRRAPAFARLRNTGQRQADAKMIVTFAGAAP
ncbi:hypothetical protein [Sphingomonas psychrotolerans]|uniref:Uncharacterized protein n=1 Tax=Sphingomonas psychrotolerans TaxID=1327635 RepID=A0A2K8MDQ7_9SPHN|nr:hypothetical protein [Sphingomonas psychrotolerans]ATY32032.1 hypothetical protein CVN68_08620 [Sphingomonas psychrotolerans]